MRKDLRTAQRCSLAFFIINAKRLQYCCDLHPYNWGDTDTVLRVTRIYEFSSVNVCL